MRTTFDINADLPLVKEIQLGPWRRSYGAHFYGALQVAAEYCGLPRVPPQLFGSWQHGVWPPWQKVQPEIIVYDAPKSMRCFVAREDEVAFLQPAGYRSVKAIGLPIIYTPPSGLSRIPNSLLVMPTHSLSSDVKLPSTDQYVAEIASLKNKFDLIVACVSAYCIANNLWVPQFKANGINIVRGAGIADMNALHRMRALFDRFEYMTTDSYGSHVFYALYFGVKVSIWGTPTPVFRENYLRDEGCAAHPEAIDKLLSEETRRQGELYLSPLRVDPWRGIRNVELGKSMMGETNKLGPEELRDAFHWTPLRNFFGFAGESVRRSPFWRAAGAAKRRLRRGPTTQV